MEPFKALTYIAAAGAISLVGAGAFGFYVGYKSGVHMSDAPVVVAGTGNANGTPLSLRPVLEQLQNMSRQIDTINKASASSEPQSVNFKPVLDELRLLARQIDQIKAQSAPTVQTSDAGKIKVIDYSENFENLKDQIAALAVKIEKADPKAPKALLDEIRALSASIQAQDPRRAISEEIRSAVNTLQSTEPRAPRALLEEIRNLGTTIASLKTQDPRAQAAIVEQIKALNASIEALKEQVASSGSSSDSGRPVNTGVPTSQIAELKTLMVAATDQFNKCQSQLAALSSAPRQTNTTANASYSATPVAVSQTSQQETSSVVFFDNVTLRKDQEKQYDEIGVRLSLQSVAPRQVKLAVNRQGVGLAFGERKVFRSQDVECELNLMETNLNDGQARISLSCKR